MWYHVLLWFVLELYSPAMGSESADVVMLLSVAHLTPLHVSN